jgi:hypothetical protein
MGYVGKMGYQGYWWSVLAIKMWSVLVNNT